MREAVNEYDEWEACHHGACDQCHQASHCLMDRQQYGDMCAQCRVRMAMEMEDAS